MSRGRTCRRRSWPPRAAAWRDEAHVAANRAAYREKMAAAERILGNRMKRPEGGFFLWLEVGNGEESALRLWREQGVRVLPGAYMGREIEPGKTQSNPGFSYVRVALVSDLSTIMTALERVTGNSLMRPRHLAERGRTWLAVRMIGGVYHPRAQGGAMSDALADARRALARLIRIAALRGAGLLLFAGGAGGAGWRWSAIHADDASLNNANGRDVSNLLGPLGAVGGRPAAADFRLRGAGVRWRRCSSGARARCAGKRLKYAMWRLVAWPLGTLTVAAGLGIFPAPASLPAGAGGWIGIAAAGLSAHAAPGRGTRPGSAWALPLFLLLVGPAAGLPGHRPALHAASRAASPICRRRSLWLAGLIKMPHVQQKGRRAAAYDDDDEDHDDIRR